ncbi:hypothetical protein E5335_09835 [Coriobacteriaceae bacterium]|nr:hypothetical protein E5335_09835 [Coriobacteriaceae bacterium]
MPAVELVTGYTGEAHIESADDGGGYASIVGPGNYVSSDVGQALRAEMPDANTCRVHDGEAWFGGRHVRIPTGSHVDVPVESGTQGQQRHDVVCVRYARDAATGVESCSLVCVKGVPGSPSAPATLPGSPLTGATSCDMPLYRIDLNGISPAAPVRLFTPMASAANRKVSASEIASGTLPVARGGTGAANADGALANLVKGRIIHPQHIEIGTGATNGTGGLIDFHFNGSSADYTSRIYEPASGTVDVNGTRFVRGQGDLARASKAFSLDGGRLTGSVNYYMKGGVGVLDLWATRKAGGSISNGSRPTGIVLPTAFRPPYTARSGMLAPTNNYPDPMPSVFFAVDSAGAVHISYTASIAPASGYEWNFAGQMVLVHVG